MRYSNILQTIGKTPLVRLNRISVPFLGEIYAKLDSRNPGASVKDRIALSMIETAEREGLITKDTTIVEPTSGNTGIGLAMVCAVKGYKLKLTMPETMSIERRKILKAFGAELILTEGSKGMKGAIEKATELGQLDHHIFIPQQFKNRANPEIHRQTTALEIWDDMDHRIDVFVSGVGTGGTITGVGEVLKTRNPQIRIIAVEPKDSPVLSGGKPGPHKIQGIGAGFIPEVLNTKIIDEIIQVSIDESYEAARNLAKMEGILVGISSGAAMAATLKYIQKSQKAERIVVFLTDTGERYLSTELWNL
jgi:cysteine synthase A